MMIQSTNRSKTLVFKAARRSLTIAGLGMCVFLGGCSKALAPTFSAVGVRETSHDGDRSVIEFLIEVKNPNKEPIPLRQVHYTIALDGQEVFAGVRSPETTLHTYSTHVFELPAVLELDQFAGSGEVGYTIMGTVQYLPPGQLAEVLFDAQMKVPEAVLNLSGTINTGSHADSESDD